MSSVSDKPPDDRSAAAASTVAAAAAAATAAAGKDPVTPGPRLVYFDVPRRRDLAQRAAAAAPGVRFASQRSWTEDPGEPRRPLLGGEAPVGVWFWKGTAEEFAAQAADVLLRFVHPLVARGLPFCLGFSFGPEALAPRSLGIGEAVALDLEDIGRLLLATAAATGSAPTAPAPPASTRTADPRRPESGPDAARLDDAQRAAVEHTRGPARILAPAGSGKTKTLVSRVVELVDRGADPSGILMLAFNRKAAEQLEERLAALGIGTTRRLGAPPDERMTRRRRAAASSLAPERPPGVHCATFNAFGYRYQREVLRARFSLDHDGRPLRALMARAMETAGVSLRELKPRRGSDPVGAFMHGLTRVRAARWSRWPASRIQVECVTDTPIVTIPFAGTHAQYTRAPRPRRDCSPSNDQIYFAVADMLADRAHRDFIQQRFDHLLVDEFQDLNGAQLALVDCALPAAPPVVRRGRRRPAHLRLAPGRPARHPRVSPPHAAQAVVGHLHAVHQLSLLAGGRRDRRASGRQQPGARGQGHPVPTRGAGRSRALLRRAVLAGARRRRLRLPARGEGAARLRLA